MTNSVSSSKALILVVIKTNIIKDKTFLFIKTSLIVCKDAFYYSAEGAGLLERSTERTYEVVNKQLTGRKILLSGLSIFTQ